MAVGRTLAGHARPYAEIPWFWTDQFDWNLQIVGFAEGWDRLVWRGDPESGRFTVFYLQYSAIVAANMINTPRDVRPVRKLIASGARISAADLEDPSKPLSALAKSG
jgi:3-phenylpropionate/trans-cinnamate dioxygenase ferredoxin reductase subunit